MNVYRYGLQHRPAAPGAVPRGYIPTPESERVTVPDNDHPERRFGVLDYAEPLSDEDVKAYELNPLGVVGRFDCETEHQTFLRAIEPLLEQDSVLVAFADGKPIELAALLKLKPWRAALIAKIAERLRLLPPFLLAEDVHAEAAKCSGGANEKAWAEAGERLQALIERRRAA